MRVIIINSNSIKQNNNPMLKLGLIFYVPIQTLVLIPLYVCLAPLCMISSSLFDWIMSWIVEDQTLAIIIILIVEWTISAILIFELMMNRTGKSIFFYEFVFFLVCSNSILIGITYSLLHRYNFIEELAAKICTSLILILIAQKMKIKFKSPQNNDTTCSICHEDMNQECIILKCKHYFHENCLWNWAYVKQECPSCKKPLA